MDSRIIAVVERIMRSEKRKVHLGSLKSLSFQGYRMKSQPNLNICEPDLARNMKYAALQKAQDGDLLLIFGDDITRCWKQIIGFNPENQKIKTPSNDTMVSSVIIDEDEKDLIQSMDLIKDERGVRLERIEEDND